MESEELRYFQALERAFIRLRGAPLLLAPADWRIAQRWREVGIPLEIVITALEEIFEGRRARGQEGRVSGLRYCRPAVEKAWRQITELRGPAEIASGGSFDVERRLDALASSLPSGWSRSEALAGSIRAFDGARLETVENRLLELDATMVKQAEADLDTKQAEALEQRVSDRMQPLTENFSPEEISTAKERIRRQELRRLFVLPVLSLFSPEVEAALQANERP